jgi:hypothetical protein
VFTVVLVAAVGSVPFLRWRRWPRDDRVASGRAVLPALVLATVIALVAGALSGLVALLVPGGSALLPHLWRVPINGAIWPLLVAAVAALTYALRQVTPLGWSVWALRRGLPPDAAPLAAAELRRTRIWRTVPAVLGALVGAAPGAVVNVAHDVWGVPLGVTGQRLMDLASTWPFDPLSLALVGYLLGAVLAEMTRRRPELPTEHEAAARLDRRTPSQYLTPLARRIPAVFTAVCVLAVIGARLRGGTEVWWPAVLAVALWLGATAAQRWVVRRPQRHVAADRLAVDDAFRSSSAHAIAGSSGALLLVMAAGAVQFLARTFGGDDPTGGMLGVALGLGLAAGIPLLWFGYGTAHRGRTPQRLADDAESVA